MKRFLGFGRKKKKEQPSPGSAGPPCPAGASELRQKDVGKLHRAVASGALAPLRQALKKCGIAGRAKAERTALHLACANGHVDVVTSLVENKWELNLLDSENRSPLMKAVQCQQEECVAVLLQHGADVNLADADGNTALHLAVVSPSTSVAVLLLEHNAEIDAQNKEGFTPLMLAVSLHHVEMVEFLLIEGADVHARDQCERTPLMRAASGGERNLIEVLLHYGADVSHKDTNGRTAADYAVIHGHSSLSEQLTDHGDWENTGAGSAGGAQGIAALSPPRQAGDAGFMLGAPAVDRGGRILNPGVADKEIDDFSQGDSIRSSEKEGSDDTWHTSEDEELDFHPKEPQKPNLVLLMKAFQQFRENSDRNGSGTESPKSPKKSVRKRPRSHGNLNKRERGELLHHDTEDAENDNGDDDEEEEEKEDLTRDKKEKEDLEDEETQSNDILEEEQDGETKRKGDINQKLEYFGDAACEGEAQRGTGAVCGDDHKTDEELAEKAEEPVDTRVSFTGAPPAEGAEEEEDTESPWDSETEEERDETQRQLSQEKSARALQEGVWSHHLWRQKELEEETRTTEKTPEESDTEREKAALLKNQFLQDEIAMLRRELDQVRLKHQEEEGKLSEENEALKEKNEDLKKELKRNEEALTQTVLQYDGQLNLLRTESAVLTSKLEQTQEGKDRLETELESFRCRLSSAAQELERLQSSKSDVERTLQRERDEWLRLQDKLHRDLSDVRETSKSLSQQLSEAENKANSLQNELHELKRVLREKTLLLETTQKELSQAQCQAKECDRARHLEKDQVSQFLMKEESMQEQLAQLQSENLLLRQQLEDTQNKGVIKEKVANDVRDWFNDIFNQLRADTEKQVYLVEERNKELNAQCTDLREQVLKYETDKVEREGMVRQLQQELADALKKQSTSEAALEVTPRYRRDLEEDKLRLQKESEEVKTKTQAASQDRLEEIRASHHTSLRHQLQHRIRDLECELDRVKNTREDSVFQKESTQAEAERFKELYLEEMKIRRCLANKLERATERVAEAKAKLLQERHRSKSLLRSSIVSEGVAASPVLYSAGLGHLGSSLALNRSLSLGGSFLNSARTALSSRSRVEAYVAQYINTSKGMLQTQDDVNGVT
ncbi:uncharacterized protein O9250_002726 [Rhynochetos jubatus]